MTDELSTMREIASIRERLFDRAGPAFSHTAHGVQHEPRDIKAFLEALESLIDAKIAAVIPPKPSKKS